MTQPGWYPDQNGGPGMKYWDGRAWHDAIPAAPAAPSTPPPAAPNRPYTPGEPFLAPDPIPPIDLSAGGKATSNRVGRIVLGAAATAAMIWGVTVLANGVGNKVGAHRSVPAPTVSLPGIQIPGVAAPAQSQDAPMDTQLVFQIHQLQMDGSTTEATAAVKVGNLTQLSGSHYGVGVIVGAVSGTVSVNPFFFAARTESGINLMPTALVDNTLPVTELPQGQKVAGSLGFDVPAGESIKEIIFQHPGGPQLGRWLVK